MDDVLSFEDGSRAMVFDLTEELIGAILLHETEALTAWDIYDEMLLLEDQAAAEKSGRDNA